MKNLKFLALGICDEDDVDEIINAFNKKDSDDFEKKCSNRHSYHDAYHPIDGISPYKRVRRVIKKYLGKQFDKAFSEYCNQVPQYQQHFFLDKFNDRHRYYHPEYYVDKQGNIQKTKTKKYKRPAIFYSIDYKTELRHKKTGRPYPEYSWMYKNIVKEDYVEVCVQGFKKEFKSHKNKEYKRLMAEKKKRMDLLYRRKRKEEKNLIYSYLTKAEKELEEQRKIDKIKILKHGFDYATSFRGNGINPDVIKKNQGF